jgi:hypothetical protein
METKSVGALADASDPRKRTVGTRDRTLRAHDRTLRASNGTVKTHDRTVGTREWTVPTRDRAVGTRVRSLRTQHRPRLFGLLAVRVAARPVRMETPAARIAVILDSSLILPLGARVRMTLR